MELAIIVLVLLLLLALAAARHYSERAEAWEQCAKILCERYATLVEEREERQGGFRFSEENLQQAKGWGK